MTATVTLAPWRAEIDELRAEIAALRAQLAGEVRTERLVVVHPDGRELVTTEVLDESIELRVQWLPGDACSASMGAGTETHDDGAWVNVAAAGLVACALTGTTTRLDDGGIVTASMLVLDGDTYGPGPDQLPSGRPALFVDPVDGVTLRRSFDVIDAQSRLEPVGGGL